MPASRAQHQLFARIGLTPFIAARSPAVPIILEVAGSEVKVISGATACDATTDRARHDNK
jgi:hypothetical protein